MRAPGDYSVLDYPLWFCTALHHVVKCTLLNCYCALHYVHYIVFHIISEYVEFNLDHPPLFTPTTKLNLLCKRDQSKHENLKCVMKNTLGFWHHCGLIKYRTNRKFTENFISGTRVDCTDVRLQMELAPLCLKISQSLFCVSFLVHYVIHWYVSKCLIIWLKRLQSLFCVSCL